MRRRDREGVMNRFDYVKYDYQSQKLQDQLKNNMQTILRMMYVLPEGRARSLAFTALEEAYMWMGKAIRDDQIARNGKAELQEERCDS